MSRKPGDQDGGLSRKIVVVGNSGVGKTALVLRYVQNTFNSEYPATIGGAYLAKKVTVDDVPLNLQIWDTAGQERFRSMVRIYYRGASAAILVFDSTDKTSFEKLNEWVAELRSVLGDNVVLAVACNKVDLANREVRLDQAQQFAQSIGAAVFETSAKTNAGVEELFQTIAGKLLQQAPETGTGETRGVEVGTKKSGGGKSGCC